MKTQSIQIDHQHFVLHPTGAIFWLEKKMLLIADVHLGKVSHFRKHGSAVPTEAIQENFMQLDRVSKEFEITTICFLGDLFHSYLNNEWFLFEDWVASKKTKMILVSGNHDIIAPQKYDHIDIKVVSELIIDQFLLSHHPEQREGFFNFCGHIHPGIMLQGTGKQKLRLPCFYQTKQQLILPAFGVFTGTHIMKISEAISVYATTKEEVIMIHS